MMKRIVGLVAAVLLAVSSGRAEALTYWDDDFENHLWTGSDGNPWVTGCVQDGCNPSISTDVAFSGTRSLRGRYTGFDSGNYVDRKYPATDEVWTRFYYRTATGFAYDSPDHAGGTKHFNLGDGVHYPNIWVMHDTSKAGRQFFLEVQVPQQNCGAGPYDSCDVVPNVANIQIADNQWYCVESRFVMNTPGVANGLLQMWVDGTQIMNRTSVALRGPNVNNPNQNSSLATWSMVRIYVQHGTGLMYYDRFAIGNTRIGCSESPSSVTTPTAPTNYQRAY